MPTKTGEYTEKEKRKIAEARQEFWIYQSLLLANTEAEVDSLLLKGALFIFGSPDEKNLAVMKARATEHVNMIKNPSNDPKRRIVL
jgi:hypothetical protein